MKFELDVNVETINKETSSCLGIVFTEEYLKEFFTRKPELIGYVCGKTSGFLDTYERDWLMDELSDDNINLPVPLNMDSDESSKIWEDKMIEFMETSDRIDVESSKGALKD